MTNTEKNKQERIEVKYNFTKRPDFSDIDTLRKWVKERLHFLSGAARERLLRILDKEQEKD